MTARVSQQIVTAIYTTNPEIRVTALAMEVLRSSTSTPLTTTVRPALVVIAG